MNAAVPPATLVDRMFAITDGWFQLFWRLVCPYVAPEYGRLLCTWVRRKQRGFENLVACIRAGKLPVRRTRPPRECGERAKPAFRLPGTRGWLLKMLAAQGGAAGHWQAMLHELVFIDAEMKDLIAAAPEQMGRLLRPLCRAASIDIPDALKRRRRPRQQRTSPSPHARTEPQESDVRAQSRRVRTLGEHSTPVPPDHGRPRRHRPGRSPFEPPGPLDPASPNVIKGR